MSAIPRVPLRQILAAVDAASDHLANTAGISRDQARIILSDANIMFDVYGTDGEDIATRLSTAAIAITPATAAPKAAPLDRAAQTVQEALADAPGSQAASTRQPAQKPAQAAPGAKKAKGQAEPRGELTNAILGALPATASQIAEKIGKPVTSVNSTLSRLSERGAVTRAGTRGNYVYSKATEGQETPKASTPSSNIPPELADALEPPTSADVAPQVPEVEELSSLIAEEERVLEAAEALDPDDTTPTPVPATPPPAPQAAPEATIDDLLPETTDAPQTAQEGNGDEGLTTEDTLDDLSVPDMLEVEGE